MFGRLWESRSRAAPAPEPPATARTAALARDLLRAVEQFVVTTPDLDTPRFLTRLRATAAELAARPDARAMRAYREWCGAAFSAFGVAQRASIRTREDEMWRLLDTYEDALDSMQRRSDALAEELRRSHSHMRALVELEDLEAARSRLKETLEHAERARQESEAAQRDHLVGLSREVARLESVLQSLRGYARFDALTGLLHGGSLKDAVAEALRRPGRCSVALMDLDGFQRVNTTLGHLAGDRLLVYLAEHLRRQTRTADAVARCGPDEFCFVAPTTEPAALQQRLAGCTFRRHVTLHIDDRACSALLSVSMGIARSHADDTAESLLGRARTALRQARAAGRAQVAIAPDEPEPTPA